MREIEHFYDATGRTTWRLQVRIRAFENMHKLATVVVGSATMAILLGAFLIHGLVPGPDMLTKNLSITYAMVWSVALATLTGVLAAAVPSRRAARLDPVVAIRYV